MKHLKKLIEAPSRIVRDVVEIGIEETEADDFEIDMVEEFEIEVEEEECAGKILNFNKLLSKTLINGRTFLRDQSLMHRHLQIQIFSKGYLLMMKKKILLLYPQHLQKARMHSIF